LVSGDEQMKGGRFNDVLNVLATKEFDPVEGEPGEKGSAEEEERETRMTKKRESRRLSKTTARKRLNVIESSDEDTGENKEPELETSNNIQ
jgi:hypothetical protein